MSSRVKLKSVLKGYTHDQDKLCPPAETLALVKSKLANLDEDILAKTMRIDTGRLGIPVYISLCGADATAVTGTPKQMGKGLTAEQSETSALMELCERYSFFSFMKNPPIIRAAAAELSEPKMDLGELFHSLHDETTDPETGRAVLNDLPLDWCWARNLTDDCDEMIPLDWFFMINEYNGPAAGNCLEEAINQALGEIVERHVASVVDFEKLTTPTIDPDSLPKGLAKDALDRFRSEGIEIYLKDFSLDTGICTIAALAWDPASLGTSEIIFQAGTTTSPEKSIIRALTEVQQMACDFQMPTTYRATLPKFGTLEEAAYLMEPEGLAPFSSLPDLTDADLKKEIENQVAALAEIGLKVYIINVTHPKLDVPSVYCIVPGAHFRFRTLDGSVLFHTAKLASKHPEEPGSVEALRRVAELEPENYTSQFFSGVGAEWAGNPAEALQYFKKALALEPADLDRPAVLTHIGLCHKDLGEYPQALDWLGQALALDSGQWEIRHQIGVANFMAGQHREALENFAQAIEISPGSGIDYANMGSCLRELGKPEEAVRMYQMALDLDPTLDFARQNIEKLTNA